jgi:hypothetical protein
VLRLLLFLLFLTSAGWSQTPDFRLVTLNIDVHDRFDRPYEVQDNVAWVGARLSQAERQGNKEVARYETLSCAGIEYPRQTSDYVKFPVQHGMAQVKFVVFEEDKTPVDYDLVLIQDNTFHPILPEKWSVGADMTHGEVKAEKLRAPHSSREVAIMGVFAVVSLALGYLLFARRLFARMLAKNMEVGSALGWSNLLWLFSWTLTALCISVMIFFPFILWQKLYWIYVLVPAAYAVVVLLIYGLGMLMTRN